MTLNKLFYATLALGLVVLSTEGYSLPFTITPIGSLPTTYPAIASYSITKNVPIGTSGNIIKWLPPNVSISPTGTTCATSVNQAFTLGYQQSCILNLLVSGAVSNSDGDPNNHLMVCLSDRVSCAGPNPAESINVSASSPRMSYIAVGQYDSNLPESGSQYPLSYFSTDGGTTWALSTSLPENQSTGTGVALVSGLQGAACDSTGKNCVSVGFYNVTPPSTPEQEYPLAYFSRDGGHTWQNPTTQPPLPSVEYYGNNILNAVSCSSDALHCTAVGTYNSQSNPLSSYTTDGGNNWIESTQPTPNPDGNGNQQQLSGITCSSNGMNCTSVGFYVSNSTFTPVAFSYTTINGGSSWSASASLPQPPNSHQTVLNGVACDSSGVKCTAVGNYFLISAFEIIPLSYVSTNGGNSWSLSHTFPPPHNNGFDAVLSVACGSTGDNCVAVGYNGFSAEQRPSSYVSTDGGNTWSNSTELPHPTGSQMELQSVVCDSTGLTCTAAGYYTNHSGQTVPLTYYSTDGGDHWALSTTQPPAFNSQSNTLAGVG